ncbi:MAG: serine/threonine-protein kinase [Kofleriaceae bacterium]
MAALPNVDSGRGRSGGVRSVCTRCSFSTWHEVGLAACPACSAAFKTVSLRSPPSVGTVIADRFELRELLGRGGMGTVFRAWQRSVGREIAIKLIAPTQSADPARARRFEREAQLASQLSHPAIVTVFDYGQEPDGVLYIAMERVRGRNLQQVAAAGALSVARIARIAAQLCDALGAAHALGIVHRDLKLENVMLLDAEPDRDRVKMLDFGLAKLVGDIGVTRMGVVVGTPQYIAPETVITGVAQASGDVFALGVLLSELALGRPVWQGTKLRELQRLKHQPAAVIAQLPPALRKPIAAMIEPDPAYRVTAEGARVLFEPLRGVVEGPRPESQQAPRPSVRRRRRIDWPFVAAVVFIVVASSLLSFKIARNIRGSAEAAPDPVRLAPAAQ